MRKAFHQLSAILFVLFSPIDTFCKNSASIDTLEIKDFSSEFLLNGKSGKVFTINSSDKLRNVIVRWDNGYFAIGTTLEKKAIGKWFLYDKKTGKGNI